MSGGILIVLYVGAGPRESGGARYSGSISGRF